MKFLLYIDILIAVTVLVKSEETSLRIARQSGYFYDKPKITFEEGNSLSDNKRISITSSKKPIYTPSTETVNGNDLSFQGDKNNYRIPIISLDSNTEKNKGDSSVRDDFLQYQKITVKSPQISNTNFPSTSNQFGQRVTTQRTKLINNDFKRPSIHEEHTKIRFNTGVLQNGQYIKTKEVTPLPTITSFTQSPFNVYSGGDDEKKINQETYSTVNKKPFPPLKPTVAPVKTISFNDGASDFELDKIIGKNKIFTSYKPLPSLPEVPASQIFIKQPQSPQILNTISTERFEGYLDNKPKKPTEISAQKLKPIQPIQTSKPVHYKPTLIPLIPSTAQQPKQTISRFKSYEIPKLPSSPLPSYKVPQTSISVAPIFITNNITYTSSRTSSPRPFKIGSTEPSIKKPLSSQPLTYKTEISVQRPSVKVAETPAVISQSPNYNIDRFSSTPKLQSYQTQKVIASKTPAKPGYQSQFYSPKTSETGKPPLTPSFAGYVYEKPKKTFEEKPSTNPLSKVPSFQTEKTKFPNAINIPYLQTSTFKPQTYTPSIPSSFHQFSKPSKQPFNLKPHQIPNNKGPEITTFPNYKPFSGSKIPFQRPVFSTQISFSTSTYRPTSFPQALKPIKTQSPTSYVYNKPKQTPITTTFTESSSYKPSQTIFNHKLNQNTTPRVPYFYEGQQFQAAFKPLGKPSSSRPLNKPLQLPSSDRPAKIPTTDENFENFSLQSTQRPFTYDISRSPGYRPSQPILPYKPSQTKNQYKPFQTHIQDRTTQKSIFKSPEILTPTYQPEKIAPHVTFTKSTQSLNYPQTQISNELIKTTNGIKASQRLPSFPKTQNSPSPLYKQSSISPFYEPKTISTYQPQKTFSNTKQPQISTTPNPIKYSFNQQNQIPFHKQSITQSFNRPIPIPHIHEVSKVSQPHKFPSFSVPSEPPINILSKPILSPVPFLPSVSSSPKPPNPYTAPLSRYPSNKPIFQGPAYIPPLESSSKKPIIYKPSSFKPYIPVSTTEKTSIYAISTYKPYFSTSATRKPIINTSSTYKIPVSSEKPYTSFNNIPYRPIISTEKPLLYTPSTYKTKLSFGTTEKPFISTGSTFKPYVPVKISQKPYIYETSSVRPFITTTKIKEPFTSIFNNFKPYIPNDTTEKYFSYGSSTSKPFVIASTTKKPLIYTYSTKKPYLSEITQKPFIYGLPEYKPKPFVAINDTGKTFDQAFTNRKPYISFTTTQKPQTYAPSPYVTTKRKPFTIASPSPKPFVSVTSSQKPITYSTYTYKPFVPVSVTQKPYFPVDSTTQYLIHTPSTRKQYISSNKSEKPFAYATPIYKPFVPIDIDQSRELSTLKPYKTISTTGKPASYKTSSHYRPFISISETKSTTAKPLVYTPSSFKPFVAVTSTRKSITGIPESTTQKPFTYTITSTHKPFVSVSRTQKPSTYAPFSRKPATSTQKSLFYTSSLEPIIVTSTTQKPFTYDTSSYKPFTTSRITYKPFESIYTTQKSITKILNAEDKSTSQSIFRTTAFGVPTRRPSTQHEDRGYLPPQPEGYFYPKPKIPFNSK